MKGQRQARGFSFIRNTSLKFPEIFAKINEKIKIFPFQISYSFRTFAAQKNN